MTKSSYGGPRSRRSRISSSHRSRNPYRRLIITGVAGILCAAAVGTGVFFLSKGSGSASAEASEETTDTVPSAEKPAVSLTIGGVVLDGLEATDALEALTQAYPWKLAVAYGEEEVPLTDFFTPILEEFVKNIYASTPSGSYELPGEQIMEAASVEAASFGKKWGVKSKNSVIERFDIQTGKFVFSEGCSGTVINQEKLVQDIMTAIETQKTDQVIQVEILDSAPELTLEQAQDRYTTLATFTTETTDNKKRNTNVKLAAQALNGTIVQPGEEFSFNAVVGQRTAEKGYQQAAAYNSGEVVQEVGGGVCQISSTLYRVVFNAGMEITFRRSHTFEPNYVTPGQDAAISWEQPDFRFINTSSAPIGIRASYSDRKASVSIYGIPVLEEGVTWDLYSEKVEDLDPPEPVYVEDPTLPAGTEKVQSAGSGGSRWVTYKVISKDGKEIERIEDHSKTYKGHAPVIRRNTGTVTLPEGESLPEQTLPSSGIDGMPEGYIPGVTELKPEESAPAQSQNQNQTSEQGTGSQSAEQSTGSQSAGQGAGNPSAEQSTGSQDSLAPVPGTIEPLKDQ